MDNAKTCPICGTLVKGRSDKKFCTTKCRSINQYEERQETEAFYLKTRIRKQKGIHLLFGSSNNV